MEQLRLFRPPGAVTQPLPQEVLREACECLAELLTVVLEESVGEHALDEGETDE
jgi:hypothetical protein